MHLLILASSNRRRVVGVAAVAAFLADQPPNRTASAKGFKALFNRYAEHGRQGLTEEQFHLANREEGVWEFRKGQLRMYCFMDHDQQHLTILTHGIVKKNQKTKAADVQAAVAEKQRYLAAKQAGYIHFEEPGHE